MFKKNLNNIWRWGARGEMGEGEEGKSVSGKYQSFQCATLFSSLFKINKINIGLSWGCQFQNRNAAGVNLRRQQKSFKGRYFYNGSHTFTMAATRLHSQPHVYTASHTFTMAVTHLQWQSHVYNANHTFTMPVTCLQCQ